MAVRHAEKFYATALNFSEQSVADVQMILERMSETIPRGFFARLFRMGPKQDDILRISSAYGCYVGELLRKYHGGQWKMMELAEANTLAIHWGEDAKDTALPLAVAQSILKGEKRHNIQLYYEAFAEAHR